MKKKSAEKGKKKKKGKKAKGGRKGEKGIKREREGRKVGEKEKGRAGGTNMDKTCAWVPRMEFLSHHHCQTRIPKFYFT